jgi:LEA14-like dessication related protein
MPLRFATQKEDGMKTRTKMHFQMALLVFLLSACASIPESLISSPRVKLSDVQVVGLGFKNQTFLLSFDVANPNPFPLPVRNVAYGVRLDGQRFASGETASEFTIPADGNATFAISVNLNILQTAPQLLSIVRDGARRDISYELVGRLGVDIPLTPPLKYNTSGTIRLNSASY